MTTIEDNLGQFLHKPKTTVTFLPEPPPRDRYFTVISVDDHLVEPAHLFEARMPAKFAGDAPRIVENDRGDQLWLFEGATIPMIGGGAAAGRPPSEYSNEPHRFDEMRRGAWDIDARIHDMDLNGVYASVNFPSTIAGFSGQRFSFAHDPELGLAAMRAWNDWHLEEWAGTHPGRIVPCQITWLSDPAVAAAEIRANAARGFRAVTFPELPEKLGLPTLNTGYWDPFLAACEETDTVVCLHVGSSSWVASGSSDSTGEVVTSLFFVGSMITTADWLFSKVALRFPRVKLSIAEGGIGWVPALIDRIEHCTRYREFTGGWLGHDESPVDVLKRNFWFCALDDTAGFEIVEHIGIDHVMVESDYPHIDTTWPNTQPYLARQLAPLDDHAIERVTWANAAELFRHPVPDDVRTSTVPYDRAEHAVATSRAWRGES